VGAQEAHVNHDSLSSDYWLYEWIDDRGIRKAADLRKALRNPVAIDHLIELREDHAEAKDIDVTSLSAPVIAGRRVDLSGYLGCNHFECIVPQIDTLFSKTWHYFDTIIVDDPNLPDPASDPSEFLYQIEQRVNLLLYLRKIGAHDSIIFRKKLSGFCDYHFRDFAKSNGLGLDLLFDESVESNVVQELLSRARFEISRREDHWHYTISHPELEQIIGTYSHSDPDIRPSREECAKDAFGMYCAGLISDVAAVREFGAPLLQVAEGTQPFRRAEPVDDSLVALNLSLPVLMNAPAKEIIRLKSDNWPEFVLFRDALRKAIRKQTSEAGNGSPEEIARAVVDEYVTPELENIEVELRASERALRKKIGANVAVGIAPVSTSLINHSPLVIAAAVIPAGYAAIKNVMPGVNKYYDDRAEIEKSPLYFLWKARIRHKG
jgi:hypothetical protein